MMKGTKYGVHVTTCVIEHRKYEVRQRTDGATLTDMDSPEHTSEFFEYATLVDVVAMLYNRAQRGLRLVVEN